MRYPLLAPIIAAALGLTACTYDPVADAEHRPPLPATPAAADASGEAAPRDAAPQTAADRVVTIAQTPGQAPSPAETMAKAAEQARDTPTPAAAEARAQAQAQTTAERDAPPASDPEAGVDLTPATDAAEDARVAANQAASDARSSFDRPAGPDADDAVQPAGLAATAGQAAAPSVPADTDTQADVQTDTQTAAPADAQTDTQTNTQTDTQADAQAKTETDTQVTAQPDAQPDTAAPTADPVEPAQAASNRTVAADGIEDIVVPVVPNAAGTPTRPNIIFLITDDQARDDFGFLGGRALTPHIDALRAGGSYLSNHYVSSSVCSPSRYACLTGQYASRTQTKTFRDAITPEGITHVMWNQGFVPGQPTLPRVLKTAGYTTGFTGKWHLGFDGKMAKVPAEADATNPADPGLIATLKHNQTVMADHLKSLGFDYAQNIYGGNPNDSQQLKKAGLNLHHQEWLTQAALNFVEDNQDGPFFLYYATTLTHTPEPVDSLETDARMSPVGLLEDPISGLQPTREDVIRRVQDAGVPRELWGATWLDDGVGALVKKLEDLGIADNTLIVYFDDHGMEYWGKGTLYQGGLVSPTMAYWPGTIPAGSTVQAMTQNTDFAPTFMALAGATPPEDMVIDGKDITHLLTGGSEPVRSSVYTEIGLTRAVTTADGWKYLAFRVPPSLQRTLPERMEEQKRHIATMHRQYPWTVGKPEWDAIDPEARYSHLGMGAGGTFFERIVTRQKDLPYMPNYWAPDQLYNLNDDPTETTNLAGDPAHAEKLAEMKALLSDYLDELPGTFMDLKPEDR